MWTDEAGYRRRALVRDGDEPQSGIPQDPPDLDLLDWEGVKREIHNLLVERGLVTWRDVQASHNGVSAVLLTVMKKRVIDLYKLQEKEIHNEQ